MSQSFLMPHFLTLLSILAPSQVPVKNKDKKPAPIIEKVETG